MTTYRPFSSVLLLCALLVVCGESAAQNSASSDADLSGLTLSAGTLDPAFARDSLSYTATVANSIDSLTIMPTSNHNGATITVNGTSVSSGSASSAISLSVGENTITIVVAAEDGKTTKTYTVTVERGVNIPDANLRATIEGALEKLSGAIITPSEMATLTGLDAVSQNISDLTGLEYATRLDSLILHHNRISDISALSGLTSLKELDLWSNRISDISALSGLTSLKDLNLWSNRISDISALSGLTSLTGLGLHYNRISDISALSGLTSLTGLGLENNSISDISALSGLTSLTFLGLENNSIFDISALSGLTSLKYLYLHDNHISDISALSGLTSLIELYLHDNHISDISALSGLTSLTTFLRLENNRIFDISALSGLTSLKYLYLDNNRISDISALSGLTSLSALYIKGNPLSYPSFITHIPALKHRGVNVYYHFRPLASLVKISGDDQTGTAGSRLSDPLIVEVRGENDVAFAGVPVTFSVTAGGGSLSTTTDTTDANGRASTRLTLGATGADTVVAAIDVSNIDKSVTFTTATGGTADLKGLTLSAGTLVPAFARDSLSYTATVANSTTSLTVTPTSNHNGATITVNGTSVSSGSASSAISLSVGENTITIVVAAEDGITTKTYTVTVGHGVNIPDANLRVAIEGALKKTSGAIITPSEMATLTHLYARGISDMTGLEYAISLDTLNLRTTNISDISALSGLTSLKVLIISDNGNTTPLSDISALSGLTSLKKLIIGGYSNTNISDISALSGLTSLTFLNLSGNNISDISALSGLTSLTSLGLHYNRISDISALSGLTSLTGLNLSYNRISDISALSGLTSLTGLDIRANPLSYPSLTTHIPALQSRGVYVSYDTRTVTSFIKTSGDDQTGTAGSSLSYPFRVQVWSQGNFPGFAGVPVAFSVTAGGGSLSTTTDTTDAYGRASTRLTLGAAGANTVKAIIDVSDIDKSVTFTATAIDVTTDLKLTLSAGTLKLTLSAGTLVPAFDGSLSYTATVANSIDRLTVTPTSDHNGATITVNGTSVSSGSASSAISLSVGENTITIVVAAEDGTTKTYTVTVERGANIPDANLRAAIEGALKKSSGAIITPSEMATLTHLYARGISDMTGLEYAISLDTLSLQRSGISDISALSGLTSLTTLNLYRNTNLSDISALSGLTSLTTLNLQLNPISDISALSGLTSLKELVLVSNNLSDISALSGLTSLTTLNLFGPSLSDISALSGLTNLELLDIGGANLSDISVLSGLTSLTTLWLPGNRISDISVLSGLTSLTTLWLPGNRISDISALSGLTSLRDLSLHRNRISDISALSGLTSLKDLELRFNPLNYPSLSTHIPALQSRGVDVFYDTRTLTSLVKISGDDQTGTAGSRLSDPFIVEVRDQNDVAFAGVPVAFSVMAGGGALSTTTDTTDANGRASTRLTLGAVGANTVKAIIDVSDIDKSVAFTVTAAQGTGPVTVVTEPGQVTGVTVAPGEGYLGVSWDAVNGATGYKVQWKSGDAVYASDRQQVIDNGSKTSATIAGLTAGTEYTVRVIATLTDADDGQPSVDVTGTPSDRPPSPPPAPPDPTPDHLPSFKGSTVTAQRYRTGTTISITLPTATGGDEALTYALTPALPSGLTFDATTRELSGTPGEIMDETEYTLTATDTDGDATTLTFTLAVVEDRLPSFSDSTRVAAQRHEQGTAIAPLTLPTATGGDEALTYALTPALPSGLTFDATTRVLSGTPQEALDATEYTLTATDADGDVATLTFTLAVIADRLPAFGDGTRIAAQRYFIGGNVRVTLPEATGGDGTLVYILLPALPKGLRFDSVTHTISGTPSKVLTETEYTLSAFDADGDFASLTFTLEVQPLTADFNGDGQVNFADFIAFVFKFGMRRGDAGYDARYDLDSDGEIGFSDGQIFIDQFDPGG